MNDIINDNSEELLQQISFLSFEQSFNSIIVTTPDVDNPIVVYANQAFSKKTGYSNEEIIGKNPKILQGDKTDRRVIDRLKKSLRDRTYFQGETVNYKKDGSEYHVEWNISPVYNNDGVLTYFVSFQTDISDQIELADKNEKLLLQQSKLSTVGELMNTVAHQWKQPLSIISGFSSRLLKKINKDFNKTELQNHLTIINEQAKFMSETISTFQNFLRPVDIANSFNLKKSIQDTISLVEGDLMTNKVSIKFSCSEDNIQINGSENEFKQVVLNLINNAKDAFVMQNITYERKLEIKVEKNDIFVNIEFIDNAGGIKVSPIEKVFENNMSTKGDKGTGIGLYIVKKIVQRLNGSISVSLIDNIGSKFSIKLPRENIQ